MGQFEDQSYRGETMNTESRLRVRSVFDVKEGLPLVVTKQGEESVEPQFEVGVGGANAPENIAHLKSRGTQKVQTAGSIRYPVRKLGQA